MDKVSLISMFVTFVTSNDVLKYEPLNPIGQGVVNKWNPPKFCNGLDCPAFDVVGKSSDKYEERIYRTASWVSTDLLDVDYKAANYQMFMKLFRYIGGQNDKEQKIAMTCPVTNRIIPAQGPACESNFTMSFFISPSLSRVPQPTDSAVYVRKMETLHVYVREFSGFTNNFEAWSKHATELGDALDKDGLAYEKSYYFTAGYDAPFKLFNRHNEIWFVKK